MVKYMVLLTNFDRYVVEILISKYPFSLKQLVLFTNTSERTVKRTLKKLQMINNYLDIEIIKNGKYYQITGKINKCKLYIERNLEYLYYDEERRIIILDQLLNKKIVNILNLRLNSAFSKIQNDIIHIKTTFKKIKIGFSHKKGQGLKIIKIDNELKIKVIYEYLWQYFKKFFIYQTSTNELITEMIPKKIYLILEKYAQLDKFPLLIKIINEFINTNFIYINDLDLINITVLLTILLKNQKNSDFNFNKISLEELINQLEPKEIVNQLKITFLNKNKLNNKDAKQKVNSIISKINGTFKKFELNNYSVLENNLLSHLARYFSAQKLSLEINHNVEINQDIISKYHFFYNLIEEEFLEQKMDKFEHYVILLYTISWFHQQLNNYKLKILLISNFSRSETQFILSNIKSFYHNSEIKIININNFDNNSQDYHLVININSNLKLNNILNISYDKLINNKINLYKILREKLYDLFINSSCEN